jgi:peptide/nickel transport system substrate-binding protein
MKKKQLLAIALVLVMALGLLAACAPEATTPTDPGVAPPGAGQGQATPPGATAPEEPQVADEDVLVIEDLEEDVVFADALDIIVDNNNIAVLNPFNPAANQASTNWTFTMIYDRLMNRNNETGEFLPSLATSVETTDYQTFRITLREDVYFHNGDHFTAEDVRWTIEASREGIGSQARDQWLPVETINILGTYELELILDDVNVDFFFNLVMPMAGMLNQRAVEEDPEQGSWIGTGAFRVVRFVTGDYVVLERNDNWWSDRPIPTRQITLRFVPEVAARAMMLRNDESQLSFGTGAEDVAWFQDRPDEFSVHPLIFNNPQGISFNMQHPVTGCWYFRRAVMSAMDRWDIAVVAAGDWAWGDERGGTLWGFETEFRNDDIPQVPFDLDAARAYLEQSVWNGEEIDIAVAIVTNIRAAEEFQQQMFRNLGITVNINQMDSATLSAWMSYGNEEKMMSFFNTAMTLSASSIRHAYIPGGGQNRGSYNNPVVTEMLERARTITDTNERRELYMELQRIVAEDPPIVNVFWRVNAIIAADGVGGFTLPSDNHHADLRGTFRVLG